MNTKIFAAPAWPYVNGPLHLGHVAGTFVPCDIFVRYHRLAGNDVLAVTGSDTHGTPVAVNGRRARWRNSTTRSRSSRWRGSGFR
jgi:methionyl-tRNA synthetase